MRHLRRLISRFWPRSLLAIFAGLLGIAIAFVWWLPIPTELKRSPAGTLTLLDSRGRELAEFASPEARTQFPVAFDQMGVWLPRITVVLEDRRFYKHRGIDWRATVAACVRNLRSCHVISGASTITQQLQTTVERLVRAHLSALNRYDITQAAVVVIQNATGAVRATVGSENYAVSQINGATQPRSCGSTLKPFVYLDAIDKRLFTAASLLPDTPDAIRNEYADYDPQNYARHYFGPVRLREALGCSLNVPAVFVLSQLRARPTFYQLQKWGFNFPQGLEHYGAGFVLGNAETRLVDLAAAYAGLARGGTAMRAKFFAAEHQPITRIASEEATAIITDILCDNEARQKSFGLHSPLAFEQRVAAKTGTSSGFRDTWTVGFDREHTVAVWAGNFDGRPMRDTFAVRAATPLWAAVMQELLTHDHPLDLPAENDKLVRRAICKATGLLPSRFSNATMSELFLAGTEPRENSADYFANDGKLLLQDAYARWCASSDNTIGAHVRSDFRITSPPPNARYQIDPVLPSSQQMVELTAACASDVEWFVNDARVAPAHDGRFFWQLAAGEWNVRAVSRGKISQEKITVEGIIGAN